ncbi:NUDIX domain-containing protein [Pseudarthrobacter scleromae]|uniref:NUDIX domain-containing protein n=1 Tax=Pseudarthrobacter scleromae TaxID=158897 RepID=UPI0036346C10
MSIIAPSPALGSRPGAPTDIPAGHTVIAAVIEWRGKVALFRRSRSLGHDNGRWHCITGFVEAMATPEQQAFEELFEETGLQATDLLDFRRGPDVVIADGSGTPWLVHTFTAVTSRRRLRLNWEHDSYRWAAPHKAKRFANRVSWLDSVLEATGHHPAAETAPASWAGSIAGHQPDGLVSKWHVLQ